MSMFLTKASLFAMVTALTPTFPHHFHLIGPLVRFLASVNAVVMIVVPLMSPLPGWRPLLNALSSHNVLVAEKGSPDTLLFPSKDGFIPGASPYSLWAFRIGKDMS